MKALGENHETDECWKTGCYHKGKPQCNVNRDCWFACPDYCDIAYCDMSTRKCVCPC